MTALIWGIIVVIVIIIIIVVIIILTSTSTTPTTPTTPTIPVYPASLHITWTYSDSTILYSTFLPAGATYTLKSDTSLSTYNALITPTLSASTVLCIYEIPGTYPTTVNFNKSNIIFTKYVDSDNINRFALVTIFYNETHLVKTTDDVNTLTDPSNYKGTWTHIINSTIIDSLSSSLNFT